jgi:hypothetical protein
MSRPVFLLLSPDGEALAADLRRRYDSDYRTVTAADPAAVASAAGEGAIAIQQIHRYLS